MMSCRGSACEGLGPAPAPALAPSAPLALRYLPVLPALLQRLTVRLCLAAAFLTGSVPAQGFVLCIRPDGRVSVDLAAPAAHCRCCADQEPGTPADPGISRAPQDDCCPCADLPVPSAQLDRCDPSRTIALQIGPSTAPPRAAVFPALAPAASARHARRAEVPRPPDSLALIRVVVLLL
jgi:hypothetical protein